MFQLTTFLPLFILSLPFTSAAVCPPAPQLPKCDMHPTFELSDVSYGSSIIYSTPAHLAVHYATVSFNLTNTAVPYTTHCTATSQQMTMFFDGTMTYQCDPPTGAGVGASSAAEFTFSRIDNSFNVKQTWNCKDGKTQKLVGSGTGKATLDCKTDKWVNDHYVLNGGEMYSTETTTCTPTKLSITPNVVTA